MRDRECRLRPGSPQPGDAAPAPPGKKSCCATAKNRKTRSPQACAHAAAEAAEPLARRAVEETGFGNVADKTTKNRLASVDLARALEGKRTVGILREDREKGVLEVATPVGVVAAVIPSTNPTSTAIYKTLIALKARNAIVLSPHPSAIGAICETATVLIRAALRGRRPRGVGAVFAAHDARGHAGIDAAPAKWA